MSGGSSKPAPAPKPKPVVDDSADKKETAEARRKRLQRLRAGDRRASLIDNSNVARTSLLGE